MKVKKTIKCKIIQLTQIKQKILEIEYNNLQESLELKEVLWWKHDLGKGLYSANKQQAERFYKSTNPSKEYPLSIRKDLIDIRQTNNKLAKYWVKIPVKKKRGGINLPIKPHQDFPEDCEICESKLFKKRSEFWIHITIQIQVKIKNSYSSILSIDLGEKTIATTVSVTQSGIQKVNFYGKEIRGIRRHYQHLRNVLGKKKLFKKIKQLGKKENRTIQDKLHKISRKIVNQALKQNSVIVIGNLKHIRKHTKGKVFNRIISNWPYHKLTKMIEYKANWEGIKVIKINEKNTSKTCYRCGHTGTRYQQSVFNCSHCGLKDFNADVNGAINITKKLLSGYILDNRAMSELALNLSDMVPTSAAVSGETEKGNPVLDAPYFSTG